MFVTNSCVQGNLQQHHQWTPCSPLHPGARPRRPAQPLAAARPRHSQGEMGGDNPHADAASDDSQVQRLRVLAPSISTLELAHSSPPSSEPLSQTFSSGFKDSNERDSVQKLQIHSANQGHEISADKLDYLRREEKNSNHQRIQEIQEDT